MLGECNWKLLECQNVSLVGCEISWKYRRDVESGVRDENILPWAAWVQFDLLLHKTAIPINQTVSAYSRKIISYAIHEVSFSVNLDLVKCTGTLRVKHSLQFINLPCLVCQSSPKSGAQCKVIETETALREFPCKTIGGPLRSQNKLKVEQNNRLKTLHFSIPMSLLNIRGKV